METTVNCNICCEIPRRGGLLPCPSGHLVCEVCFDSLLDKICPECGEAFVNAPGMSKPRSSSMVDKLLDKIVFYCR